MSRVRTSQEMSRAYWALPAMMVARREMSRKYQPVFATKISRCEYHHEGSVFVDQPNKGCKKVPFRERRAGSVVAGSNPSEYRKTDIFPAMRRVHFAIFSAK